ncbi:MAG TPA: penicillin-binding transpeptidase domain-containing protein [Pseudonocardiaceae bacterium]|nr:penicillin-binding transpeptidase domain-containing protein [Pseudonocardiaceae bacterium]
MSVAGLAGRKRLIVIIAAVVVVIVVVVAAVLVFVNSGSSAGSSNSSSPMSQRDVANEFLDALVEDSATDAGQDTTNPTEATDVIKQAHDSLKPTTLTTSNLNVGAKTVTYTLTWGFGPNQTWSDPSSFTMSQDKGGNWKVDWSPSIITPKLRAFDQLTRNDAGSQTALPTVLGSDGSTLLAPTPVISVTLNPSAGGDLQQTAAKLSAALNQFDATITTQSIVSQAASGNSTVIVNLRQSDFDKVKAQLSGLTGVSFPSKTQLLGPTKNFGSAILPAIRTYASGQSTTQNTPLTVSIDHADGAPSEVVYSSAPGASGAAPGTISTSLSAKLQTAAETALGNMSHEAMAVAIQPSTGKILAVAENSAASSAGDNPLTSLYPPGSTFKIVTASAAFNQGKLTPQSSVACPGTTSIEGRTIQNETQFNLGTTSVTTAFARSCNTTFSQVAAGLGPDDLPTTAKLFGIGVDYNVPNITTNTGKVASDSDTLARAEDGFGQGTDLVSVFGMALVAATAAHGSTPVPSLIAGQTTTSDTAPKQLSGSTVSSLKTLMRAVVTSGTASDLAGISPPVYGKTGTAQFGDGSHSHGWFVGYQGDVAFAFLVVDAGSSSVAVSVAHQFFANADK